MMHKQFEGCAKMHGVRFCGSCAKFPCDDLPEGFAHFAEFQSKIKANALTMDDFLNNDYFEMFNNANFDALAERIANCMNPGFERGEDKLIYHIPLDNGWEVRMDFVYDNGKYRLAILDSYTIPLKRVDHLPFNTYVPLPERESIMRQEYAITKTVDYYNRLKELIGRQEALAWFKDGKAEQSGVPAWMPYFTKRKAFIAYTAWMQNRIYGEDVYITAFTEEYSELFFRNCSWLFLYKAAGHIKRMIPFDAFIELFEVIWKDRALCNGYTVGFSYENEDVIMLFSQVD